MVGMAMAIWLSIFTTAGPILATPSEDSQTISVVVLEGKNGKPMPREHLLGLVGGTQEEVRPHGHKIDLETNLEAVALLPPGSSSYSRIQIWVDRRTLYQRTPNLASFSLDEVRRSGASTANTCGHFDEKRFPMNSWFMLVQRPCRKRCAGEFRKHPQEPLSVLIPYRMS